MAAISSVEKSEGGLSHSTVRAFSHLSVQNKV